MNTLAQTLLNANNYNELLEHLAAHDLSGQFFGDDVMLDLMSDMEDLQGLPEDNFQLKQCWEDFKVRINKIIASSMFKQEV